MRYACITYRVMQASAGGKIRKIIAGLSDYSFEIIGINACNKRNMPVGETALFLAYIIFDMGALYAGAVQLITMDEDIENVSDLKGKRVSIGAPGSGIYFNALDVLEGAGLTVNDIKPQYQSFEV